MQKIIALFIVILLSSCSSSYTTSADQNYIKSKNGKLVEVPAPLTGENINHFFDLPPAPQDARIDIKPPH